MPKAKVNGIELYYELHGKGKPLVLIIGFGFDHTAWLNLPKKLAEHFQVLVLDNRGSGQSSSPDEPYTIDQMAEDTMELIKLLKLDKPHILGQSMGTFIAQKIAIKYPKEIDKLILCTTTAKVKMPWIFYAKMVLQQMQEKIPIRMMLQGFLAWGFSDQFLRSEEKRQEIIDFTLGMKHLQTEVGYTRQLEAVESFDTTKSVQKIQAKTLILYGGEDIITPQKDGEEVHSKIRGSQIRGFEKSGHNVFIEQKTEFLSAVLNFLKG